MRALEPDLQGFVERDGVSVGYEVFGAGSGRATVLLLPAWTIVNSLMWKAQVPFLARHFQVVTFDSRGSGRSHRPNRADLYGADVGDAIAVLDAVGAERAIVSGVSGGGVSTLVLAAQHGERVLGAVPIASSLPFISPPHPSRSVYSFNDELDTDDGWAKFNRHAWQRDYRGFLEFFVGQIFTEAHSQKQIEDCVGWGLECGPDVLTMTMDGPGPFASREAVETALRSISCPLLAIHGSNDLVTPLERSRRIAELTGGSLVILDGAGHCPPARHPVRVNQLLHDFATQLTGPERRAERHWQRAASRGRRALIVSSPIGLGHARRDIAIARELRALCPDLEIDWLAQPPVTAALDTAGERVHPASARLVSESALIEAAASEHRLEVFEAIRQMDELFVANYMLFREVVRETPYDVWIGDEAWEVDYFLHENPEDKLAPYVFLTDFVGQLPLPEGGEREALLTADLNAEMLEQIARFPYIRDRSIFVGEPADIVPDSFGPGLPAIRAWTEQHFAFTGHITGRETALQDRAALRARLGYAPDEQVCIVAVGGSAVGQPLLRQLVQAHDATASRVPRLRMIAVAGPRIDKASLHAPAGVEVRGYVPDLDDHLAACDIALVQGGLTTTMELVAAGRPFISFPLRGHYEQRRHVAQRLARHGHTRSLEIEEATPERVADAIATVLAAPPPRYAGVPEDGAARAAELIAAVFAGSAVSRASASAERERTPSLP